MEAHARMGGQAPALVTSFHRIVADLSAGGWAGRVVRDIARYGATNFVALDLSWPGAPANLLSGILRGDADALLARTARSLASVGQTVLVEPAWEMNGNWDYRW